MADARRHLSVEIELDAHSLSGTVADGGADAQRFRSWLELMNAVELRRPDAGANGAEAGRPLRPARRPTKEIDR